MSDSLVKKQKMSKIGAGKARFTASALTLPIIIFLVFWVFVNFDSLLLAFQHEVYVTDADGVSYTEVQFTFDNFKRVWTDFFTDGNLMLALRNTTLFYLASVLVVLPASVLFSYFIYKKIALYKFFRVVVYLPTIISGAALVALYKYTFMTGGPFTAFLKAIGTDTAYFDLFSGEKAIWMLLIYNCIFGLGGYVVIFGGAMNSIDQSVIEAGKIDGCNWLHELFHIILPMIWPTISTVLLLGLASFISATGPILAMTKNNSSTYTLSYLLYCYATGVGNLGQDIYYASAVGLTLSVLSVPLVIVCRKLINRVGE